MRKENLLHIFSRIPQLETDRLLLRAMRVDDAEDMFDYAKEPDVTKFLLWRPHASINYTREYLQYVSRRYRLGDFYDWAVVDKASGRMIGTCGFAKIDCTHNCGEIGYVLNPAFRGRELMPEAARRVMRFGFDMLGLNRIEARYMVGNDASRRVMEKLGMQFEGVHRASMLVKGSYRDIGTCAILKSEFPRE